MRYAFIAALAALTVVAGCETSGGGYGGGYGNQGGYGGAPAGPQTRLSACGRNALIGAGVGAVVGAIAAPKKNRVEDAAIGAAVAGGGAYAVCRYLDGQQKARIAGAYANAASSNQPVGMNWVGTTGTRYVLQVDRPQPGQPGCRVLNATLQVNNNGPQPLPQEMYCQAQNGAWVPASY